MNKSFPEKITHDFAKSISNCVGLWLDLGGSFFWLFSSQFWWDDHFCFEIES